MIKLTRVPIAKAKVIVTGLKVFIADLEKDTRLTVLQKMTLSIAKRMYDKYAPKVNKHFSVQHISFNMYYEEAYTLYEAFLTYQEQLFTTDLNHAIIDNLKIELYQQLH